MPPSPAAANLHRSGAEAFEMITLRRTSLALVAPPPPGARSPQTAARAPDGSREPRELPAHGGIPVAGAPGTKAEQPGQQAAASGEKTDPSGSIITESPDPLLKGMDAGKANDSAYRAAYRACMKARLRS